MKLSYIASSGNIYDLTARIITRKANFHAWVFESVATSLMYGERVSGFRKKASAYQVELVIDGGVVKRKALLNALHDDFENDIRNLKAGRVMFGDWYCDCFVTSSQTQPDEEKADRTENTIDIYVPSGFWVRDESKSFSVPTPVVSEYLGYPYDYAYDFTPPPAGQEVWETDSPFASDFEMRIYGPCANPQVTINGYPYAVFASVPDGSTLVINSKDHTVMMGEKNLFDARNKVYSVFEKIPSGSLTVSWSGFAFDLTLFEERSEPKW